MATFYFYLSSILICDSFKINCSLVPDFHFFHIFGGKRNKLNNKKKKKNISRILYVPSIRAETFYTITILFIMACLSNWEASDWIMSCGTTYRNVGRSSKCWFNVDSDEFCAQWLENLSTYLLQRELCARKKHFLRVHQFFLRVLNAIYKFPSDFSHHPPS